MEIAKQVYKRVTPSKITKLRSHTDHTSHGGKRNVGEAALFTRPKKVCSGKRKKHYLGHPRYQPTSDKTCLVHGPIHFTKEYKVLNE